MGKTISVKQLSEKKYYLPDQLSEEFRNSIGEIEDAFDVHVWGKSGNGKSNFTAKLTIALALALDCKTEYVAYEEGHGKTLYDTFIKRHNMHTLLKNKLLITDHLTYPELVERIQKKQSAKLWIIDSIQASRFTAEQCLDLRNKFVLSKKKKIIIFVGWAEGSTPAGSVGKSVEYYAHIKIEVKGFIAFFRSRFGGNKEFVIWEGNERQGAIRFWGKEYWKITGQAKPAKEKKVKELPPPPKQLPASVEEPQPEQTETQPV